MWLVLVFTATWGLPQRYLVTDLMSYDGSPSKDNLSPYQGLAQVLFRNLSIRHVQIDPSDAIKVIEQTCSDFDPLKQGTLRGPYQRYRDFPAEEDIPIRLEDIDQEWVHQYATQLIIGYKDRGGASAYKRTTQTAPAIEDEESGDVSSATETLVDSEYTVRSDLNTVRGRLPYLLKRVHDLSKKYRVNLISYLQLWYYAKGGYSTLPAPRDILSEGRLLRMGDDGNPDGYFPASANSGKVFPVAKRFMDGVSDDPDYHFIQEFIQALNVLEIDIRNEHPEDYNQKFIDGLIVTYVESNHDFIVRGRKLSPKVYSALGDVSVSDWDKTADVIPTSTVDNFVSKVQFNQALVEWLNRDPVSDGVMNYFLMMYHAYGNDKDFYVPGDVYMLYNAKVVPEDSRQAPNVNCLEVVDGFVALPGTGIPYVFNLSALRYKSKNMGAVLTSSGKLVLVRDSIHTEYIGLADANVFLAEYAKYKRNPPATLLCSGVETRWGAWKELTL